MIFHDDKLVQCTPMNFSVKDKKELKEEEQSILVSYKDRPGKYTCVLLAKDRTKKNKKQYGCQLSLFNQ